MLPCVNSKALETRSGWNMLIIPHSLELVIKKKSVSLTLKISILKIILSFKTRQISTTFVMTTKAAQRQIGKYLIKGKHKKPTRIYRTYRRATRTVWRERCNNQQTASPRDLFETVLAEDWRYLDNVTERCEKGREVDHHLCMPSLSSMW